MKLNYRDRVLLGVLLAVILIVAGFFLLIKPKNADIKTNKATLADLEVQRDEVDAKIAEIPGIKSDITQVYNDTQNLTDDFVERNSIYSSRAVDQYMQGFAEDNKVKVYTLNTQGMSEATLEYYYFKYSDVGSEMKEQADINGTYKNNIPEEKAESDALEARDAETVLQSQYSILVSGEKEDIWNYMKALEEQDETIIINAVTLENLEIKEKPDTNTPNSDEEEEEPTAQFIITLYSVYDMDEPNLEME